MGMCDLGVVSINRCLLGKRKHSLLLTMQGKLTSVLCKVPGCKHLFAVATLDKILTALKGTPSATVRCFGWHSIVTSQESSYRATVRVACGSCHTQALGWTFARGP